MEVSGWLVFLVFLGIFYAIISLCLAFVRIINGVGFELTTRDVPRGDLEYFGEAPPMIDGLTLIFFPSVVLILLWLLIVTIVNAIIN